jgi:hypothetical protein
MVTRHLGRALPRAQLVSGDIHPEAVAFLQGQLGVDAVGSTDVPEVLDFGRAFDVVFALSFFSTCPSARSVGGSVCSTDR